MWDIAKKFKHTTTVDCKYRLIGHEVPVTCVRYGQLEVLSGDNLGRVFIWWMQTGEILKKIQVGGILGNLCNDCVNSSIH